MSWIDKVDLHECGCAKSVESEPGDSADLRIGKARIDDVTTASNSVAGVTNTAELEGKPQWQN